MLDGCCSTLRTLSRSVSAVNGLRSVAATPRSAALARKSCFMPGSVPADMTMIAMCGNSALKYEMVSNP
jgi:hypothetical protein